MATDTELGQQHLVVLAHVKQLSDLVGEEGRKLPHAHARNRLAHHIKTLHETLVEHFADEEEDGYFGALRAERPELDHRIERLKGEHAPLLEALEILDRRVPHANLGVIKEEVRKVLDTLRRHEAGERALLQDAVVVDVGVGD